jgi:formylglycine-generating enzyme required for sulfatase activity
MEDLDTVYVMLPLKDARKIKDTGKLLFEEHDLKRDDDYSYPVLGTDTSASGYRVPTAEEWFFLMRAGASTRYYWGDEEDSLTVSRYAWFPLKEDPLICRPFGTDPNTRVCEYPPKKSQPIRSVAQLIPNRFGLYDMFGLAAEGCRRVESAPECYYVGKETNGSDRTGFRLLRKTPKLHKLEKF